MIPGRSTPSKLSNTQLQEQGCNTHPINQLFGCLYGERSLSSSKAAALATREIYPLRVIPISLRVTVKFYPPYLSQR